MNMVKIFADAYYFFIGNLRQLAELFLPLLLITTALQHGLTVSEDGVSGFWMLLASFLFYPLYTGALIQLLVKRTQHESPTNGQLLHAALRLWWPLLLLMLILFAAVIFGFMLLIIPGIWIAVRMAFADIYVVSEGLTPLAAMRKSHDATKTIFWQILLVAVCIYVPLIALSYLLGLVVDAYGGSSTLSILAETVVSFLGIFASIAIFRIYLLHTQPPAQP